MNNDILSRYEQAQKLMQGTLSNRIVMNDAVFPHWVNGSNCFWYTRETKNGKEFRLVDAKAATNSLAFDHEAVAKALAKLVGKSVDFENLPINGVSITSDLQQLQFQSFDKSLTNRWSTN